MLGIPVEVTKKGDFGILCQNGQMEKARFTNGLMVFGLVKSHSDMILPVRQEKNIQQQGFGQAS